MRRRSRKMNPNGFSMVEAVIALGIGLAFLAAVTGVWTFSSTLWKEESARSRLRTQIEIAIERMQADIRLADGNGILFYPSDTPPYTAISLPHATADSNGFLTFSGGAISWDQTIIYHTFVVGTKTEFRRTLLNSYNSSSSARQTELNSIVANGEDISGGESSTRTLFSVDTASFQITSQSPTFDGYAASISRSGLTNFGSIKLSSGNHDIRFEVTGKNASSSGYRMGFDSITLTPSGDGDQEAEELPVSASSGQTQVDEDMTPYAGVWSGNYQTEYQSSAVGNYLTFQVYYDQWFESNFGNMTHSSTAVSGTNPVLTVLSRESQSVTPAWLADTQTSASSANEFVSNKSIRCIIGGSYVTRSGQMVRIKFMGPASGGNLTINAAYFGQRTPGTADFTMVPSPLYFDNAQVVVGGSDPVGATTNPGTNTSITISPGYYAWSNWFEYSMTAGSALDYMVSLNVTTEGNASSWTQTGTTHSYRVDDASNAYSDDQLWSLLIPPASTSDALYAVAEVASWVSSGTATSQVYDTQVTTPSYLNLTWGQTLPAGSSVSFKVRTSNSSSMTGATDWSALPSYTTSPTGLGGLANQRYVQFQTTLQAASPYTTFPSVDNVKINWPGQTGLVQLTGYFTKRPNYGIFKLLVDGDETTQALQIEVSNSENYRGKTLSFSLKTEATPRNTGK